MSHLPMQQLRGKAGEFWDREVVSPWHVSGWMEALPVREAINRRIGGTSDSWPLNWLERTYPGRRFPRALSIGCGTGTLERDLLRRNLCDRVDAFDGSMLSLLTARAEARAAGVADRVRYYAADFNEPAFHRQRYDAVFFQQSLHHVGKLEKLLAAVLLALKPDGLLYLDEYVGPSRSDWSAPLLDEQLRPQRAFFATLDPSLRRLDQVPPPIAYEDPSEAIRSSEIVRQLGVGFDIEQRRDYGGNLLSIVYAAIDWTRASSDVLASLVTAEDELLHSGAPSWYALFTARPKRGLARRIALVRYWAEPKARRVGIAVRRALLGW